MTHFVTNSLPFLSFRFKRRKKGGKHPWKYFFAEAQPWSFRRAPRLLVRNGKVRERGWLSFPPSQLTLNIQEFNGIHKDALFDLSGNFFLGDRRQQMIPNLV
jgi:hypothetical protein